MNPFQPTPQQQPANRAAEVYERLRQAIVEGSIRPNERLIEAELAERLNVSRTPVRETMLRLAGDGLIVNHRRGWVVREHSPEEVREVYEVRAALEGFAARLAAERATDEQLRALAAIHAEYAQHAEASPRGEVLAHNDAFHDAVIQAAHNDLLAQRIGDNSQYYFIHRIAGFLSDEEARSSIAGHENLVQALLSRDADRAEAVARENVFEGLQKVLSRLPR